VTDVAALLAEAEARPFTGWDFSPYRDRTTILRPWDYTQMAVDLARESPGLLDMGTGGGEWLAALPVHPPLTVASEAWPPNVALAARTLRAIGGCVVQDEGALDNDEQLVAQPRGRLPYRAGAFHLVVNRHEAFVAAEVARVLAPGGVFLTQQVDNGNLDDCCAWLDRPSPPPTASWLPLAVAQVRAAGLTVEDARVGVETYRRGRRRVRLVPQGRGPAADDGRRSIDSYRAALVRLGAGCRRAARDPSTPAARARPLLTARRSPGVSV
jgi:SAM-dependent methyltransferase